MSGNKDNNHTGNQEQWRYKILLTVRDIGQ